MDERRIKSGKQGKQIDDFLRMILEVLDKAPENNGKVLYIKQGKINYANGEELFNITPLT